MALQVSTINSTKNIPRKERESMGIISKIRTFSISLNNTYVQYIEKKNMNAWRTAVD